MSEISRLISQLEILQNNSNNNNINANMDALKTNSNITTTINPSYQK
jgi:hypothetical protein